MDQHTLTFAFPFPAGEKGARLVNLAQDVCAQKGLRGNPPNMGPHATIIPPFYCSTKERQAISMLTRHMWKFNGKWVLVKAGEFGVFSPSKPNDNTGAIYISLEIDPHYREFVEKHKIDWPFEFVNKPSQTAAVERVWIPHLSVIEGPDLHTQAPPLFPQLNEYVSDRVVVLGEPLFFEKQKIEGKTQWSPILT